MTHTLFEVRVCPGLCRACAYMRSVFRAGVSQKTVNAWVHAAEQAVPL